MKTKEKTKISVYMSPSQKRIDSISDIQHFVEELIQMESSRPEGGVLGQNCHGGKLAVVSIEGGFQIPVPIIKTHNNKMFLYNYGTRYEFSLKEAAIVLAMYYFLYYEYIKCTVLQGEKLEGFMSFAFGQAVHWEDKMGGNKKCLETYRILQEFIMIEKDLFSKAIAIID